MDNLIFEVLMLSKNHKNEKQTRAILRTLTTSQRYKIQKFIRNILNGKITLSDSVYQQLSRYKIFLRSTSNRFCISYILKNYNAFSDILNIMLKKVMDHIKKVVVIPYEEWRNSKMTNMKNPKILILTLKRKENLQTVKTPNKKIKIKKLNLTKMKKKLLKNQPTKLKQPQNMKKVMKNQMKQIVPIVKKKKKRNNNNKIERKGDKVKR